MIMNNPHAGHRQRLRERAEKEGLSSFAPHELLELLLMHMIPVRDVNPLGHALIDRFGSVGAVLSAPADELALVSGIGKKTALRLRAFGSLLDIYVKEKEDKPLVLDDIGGLYKFIRQTVPEDNRYLVICLDKGKRIIEICRCSGEAADIVRCALRMNAAYVCTVHYEAEDSKELSRCELKLIKDLNGVLKALNTGYVDHVAVFGQRLFSFREAGLLG